MGASMKDKGCEVVDDIYTMLGVNREVEPDPSWTLAENLAYMERKLKEDGK